MEIELLSKMLRELLPERETVSLPGLGEFVSVPMPATFSDRGRTIIPPYVKVSFIPTSSNDGVLVDMYAAGNNIESDAAETIVLGYLRELRETLEKVGTVVFPSLGTLRRTRRGDFLFIQDDDLDIFPDFFGLQPISLRTEPKAAGASSGESHVLNEAVLPAEPETPAEPEISVEPETPAEPVEKNETVHPGEEPQTVAEGTSGHFNWLALLIAVGVVAMALAVFAVLGRLAPELVDHILYSPEEYKILHP